MEEFRLALRVSITEFCNLELLRVGLYRVEVDASLLLAAGGGRRYAELRGVPTTFSSAPSRLYAESRGRRCDPDAEVRCDHAGVDDTCFRTRVLHVRYGDEAHAVCETCLFSFAGVPSPCAPGSSLLVRFRLFRATPLKGGGAGAFELCAARALRAPAADALRGLRAWAPVTFGAAHLALAGVALHSAVTGARFAGAPPAPPRPRELAEAEASAARGAREEEEEARRGVPGAAAARFAGAAPSGEAAAAAARMKRVPGSSSARFSAAAAAAAAAPPPPPAASAPSRPLPPWAADYAAALRARAAAPLSLCEALALAPSAAPARAALAAAVEAALAGALAAAAAAASFAGGEAGPGARRVCAEAFANLRGAEAALREAEAAAAAWGARGGDGAAVNGAAWAARAGALLAPLDAAAAAAAAWRREAEAAGAGAGALPPHRAAAAAFCTYSTERFFLEAPPPAAAGAAAAAAAPAAAPLAAPAGAAPAASAAAALEEAARERGRAAEEAWRALCGALLAAGAAACAPLQGRAGAAARAWARAACATPPPLPLRELRAAAPPLAEGATAPPALPAARAFDAAAECAPFALRAVAQAFRGGAPPPPPAPLPPPPPTTHVVVFINGLGGHKADLRCLRGALKLHRPRLLCVSADSVAGSAGEGDVLAVGLRLAAEIAALAGDAALAAEGMPACGRLSIVAFSMGGVWARVALRAPALAPLRGRLHAFVTLASPHLGFPPAAAGHALVSAGAFFTRLAGRLPVLAQLAHADRGREGEPSLLDLLAEGGWGAGGGGVGANAAALAAAGLAPMPNGALLAPAKHVILVASPQDTYSPFHSALAAAPGGGGGGGAGEGGRAAAAFWRGIEGPPGGDGPAVWRVALQFSDFEGGGGGGGGAQPWAARAEAAGLLPPRGDAGSAQPPPPPASLSAVAAQGLTSVFNSVSGRGAHLAFTTSEELGALLALAEPFAQCWEEG
jgi:hypothetical protein